MPMGKGREIAAGCKNIREQAARVALASQGICEVHAHGSYAHDAAAPFAVFMAPATLPRLVCNAERQVVPGARRVKSLFCWSSQLNFAFPVETRREFS